METNFKVDMPSFALGFNTGKKKGGGTPEGFHVVRFFNDDRTTLLYTVFVPTGANAMYAGETPVSAKDTTLLFTGFEPSPTNVTEDMDCYAAYDRIGALNETSWETISKLSAEGKAQNYFAVGDTKMIHVEGVVGTLEVNGDYGVYILGFDHNEDFEGKGIHFGTFKPSVGSTISLCLTEDTTSVYYKDFSDGEMHFNMNHWGDVSYGGWAGCDLRYDVLGSTNVAPSGYGAKAKYDRVGYDPTATCAIIPIEKTLMAALPADLRAVMKPMIKYTDNVGDGDHGAENITATIDYLPLPSAFEVTGSSDHSNTNEQHQQRQYDYYAQAKNSRKFSHLDESLTAWWWARSPRGNAPEMFCCITTSLNSSSSFYADKSTGLAPIFKV